MMSRRHDTSGLLDGLREGLQVIDREYRYVYVNPAAAQHGKRAPEELIGRTMSEMYPGIEETEMFATLRHCMTERTAANFENEFTFSDGSSGWFELRMQPVKEGLAILSVDITERKNLELQLRQSQKMESLGRLASSVAHDVNNLLTVILTFGGVLVEELEGTEEHADVEEIINAANSAVQLTQQLLAFSRKRASEPTAVDINAIVSRMESMLEPLIGPEVQLELLLEDAAWPVRADDSGMEQVLMNLILNGADAMKEGTLTVETRNVHVTRQLRPAPGVTVPPGEFTGLRVSDEGPGVPKEIQEKIFEPFFTTKECGQGTGLGLSTSYGIVRRTGGYLWVESPPGEGATFEILLPRFVASEEQSVAPAAAGPRRDEGGSILVVDDDLYVRRAISRSLRRVGYDVAEADGEAPARVALADSPVDLVIVDVSVGSQAGPELLKSLSETGFDGPLLFMSGHDYEELPGSVGASAHLLYKPFTPEHLVGEVKAALGQE